MLAAGGAIAYAGLLAILATVVILLANAGLDWWASTLLVGVGAVLVLSALLLLGFAAVRTYVPVVERDAEPVAS